MGAIFKLTATAYLLVGLGMNLPRISSGLPENPVSGANKSYERLTFVQINILPILAQDPPPPDKPRPEGGSEGAGGRCVIEVWDLSV